MKALPTPVPPGPVQITDSTVEKKYGPRKALPLGPPTKPKPLQICALLANQNSVENWPALINEGEKKALTLGGGGGGLVSTETLALAELEPPGPVQVTVTVMLLLGLTLVEPEVPEMLTPPVLEQLLALLELQLNVVLWPITMAVGLKLALTVGGVELSSTVNVAESEPEARLPLIAPAQFTVAFNDCAAVNVNEPNGWKVVNPGTPVTLQREALGEPSQKKVTLSPVTAVEGRNVAFTSRSWACADKVAPMMIRMKKPMVKRRYR
ncbi:MAG: hypothetical protein Tsb002_29830 [Wenzhouxiangellaceae bacterium]